MKVLFISSDNNASSGAFLSMTKLNVLLRDKFGVLTKVVLPREGDGKALLDEAGIPSVIIPSVDWVVNERELVDKFKLQKQSKKNEKFNGPAISCIAEMIKTEGFDLVHLNTTYAEVGATAALEAGIPFIWHIRELIEEDQGRVIINKEKAYRKIAKADRVIAISSCVYDKYKKLIPDARIVKIFNGIDITRFYDPDKEIMQDENYFTLLYGGGYSVKKGIFELASALNYLRMNGIENFRLLLVGEPSPRYRDYLKITGLEKYVEFLGYQKAVEKWLKKADIAFSCSTMEAFGRKTVEAMLSGCLMIASNTGGSLDIVKDRETGLLYEQGDPLSLAYTILHAMRNREESKKIAYAGRDYARENFTADKNASEVFCLYEKVLSERKG